jgi:hypothetical protein
LAHSFGVKLARASAMALERRVEGLRGGFSQRRLQLGERLLDRVEIGL